MVLPYNMRSLNGFFMVVKQRLYKWLNRRGGKKKLNWDEFSRYVDVWYPLLKPSIKHSFIFNKTNLTSEEPDAGKPLVRMYVQQRLVYSEG